MQVFVEGEESNPAPVDSGELHGRVLGPLLFLCHIKYLPDSVKSPVCIFADNCLLYRTIRCRQDHDILQEYLNQLKVQYNWGMRINAKICYILTIITHNFPNYKTAPSASSRKPISRSSNIGRLDFL